MSYLDLTTNCLRLLAVPPRRNNHRTRPDVVAASYAQKFMKHLIDKNSEPNRPENKEMEEALRSTKLMSAFNEAKEAMGCPVKAAYQCPSFVRFLDKAEKRELKR